MNYSTEVKQRLLSIIEEMDSYCWLFTKNPETDFSRKKKWSFEEIMKFMLTMEGKSLRDELLEYFDFDKSTLSNSAFNQRRAQILPEAFEFLFQEFTNSFSNHAAYKGLRLIACDGSDLCIAHNPKDETISQDSYECVITNLPQEKFSADKIKQLYAKRRGIETSFRELKYALGLTKFHAKKPEYIKQEIWSRMTLYNFCEIITTNVVVKKKEGCKHMYQLNYTRAIRICRHFLSIKKEKAPPDAEYLIGHELLPIRPGRTDPRKVKTQSMISFLYRSA